MTSCRMKARSRSGEHQPHALGLIRNTRSLATLRIPPIAILAIMVVSALPLARAQAQSPEEIGKLVETLGADKREERESAAGALVKLGAKAIPALVVALSDKDATVRELAARSLGAIGPMATPSVDALASALSDRAAKVRAASGWALSEIGPKAALAVGALAGALSDEDAEVRMHAVRALGAIGPEAAPAIPALGAALSDEEEQVRLFAYGALFDIGNSLKSQGTLLWWAIPRVYWKELVGLLLLLAVWFALLARFPRQLPKTLAARNAFYVLVSLPPSVFFGWVVITKILRGWTRGYLPSWPLVQVPSSFAVAMSGFLCVLLASVWACQRKRVVRGDPEP